MYRYGSTTMMLANGMHARRDEPRDVALWRQRLVATGRRGEDPMV